MLLVAATGAVAFSMGQGRQDRTPATVISGGDSVFHETMVDMNWQEVEKAAKDGAVVLMTTAVIEEHGPHMTCGTDAYLGYLLCKLTRRELESRGVRTLVAPPFFWGINQTTHVFPGTFTVSPETMKALLGDILSSLKSMGFTNIFNINAHMDSVHTRTVLAAIIDAQKNLGLNVRYVFAEEDARASGLTGEPPPFILLHKMPATSEKKTDVLDMHAGTFETAMMAAYFPGQVNTALARTLQPTRVTAQQAREWVKDARKVTPLGYVGDPASFNVAEARTFVERWCRSMADAIQASVGRKQ